jgi:hypothetical protein
VQLLNAYELPYFILEFQYEIVPLEDGTLYVPVFLQLNLIKFAVNYATEYATEYFLSKISGLKKVLSCGKRDTGYWCCILRRFC